jgi:hypothetical protein
MKKQVIIKVYSYTGEFIKLWTNASFKGFTKELNAGLGECVIDLFEKFDYQGAELTLGNTVEISISDNNAKNLLIYSGYISLYEPNISGGKESISVSLLGHYTKLGLDVLKNSTQTNLYTDSTAGLTTSSPGDSAEIGLVLRAIIDRYIAENSSTKIGYTLASIPDLSQSAFCFFEMKTYSDAIDFLVSMISSGYNWYVDEYGTFYIKSKPATATHTFIFGRHFSEVNVERSVEKVRNALLFWNGKTDADQIFKLYSDAASIEKYGRRIEKATITGVDDETTADQIGSRFLDENKDPSVK